MSHQIVMQSKAFSQRLRIHLCASSHNYYYPHYHQQTPQAHRTYRIHRLWIRLPAHHQCHTTHVIQLYNIPRVQYQPRLHHSHTIGITRFPRNCRNQHPNRTFADRSRLFPNRINVINSKPHKIRWLYKVDQSRFFFLNLYNDPCNTDTNLVYLYMFCVNAKTL